MARKTKKKTNKRRQSDRAVFLNFKLKSEVDKMPKIGTQKVVEIEGVKYTLQHPGSREYLRIQDRTQNEFGVPSMEKMAEELFKHVVVDPKVSIEYFDEHDGMDELIKEAMNFLRTGK